MARKPVPSVAGTIILQRIAVYFSFLESEYHCTVSSEVSREPVVTYTAPFGGTIKLGWCNQRPPRVLICKPSHTTPPRTTEQCYDAEDLALAFGRDDLAMPFVPLSHGLTEDALDNSLQLQAQAIGKLAGEFLSRGNCDIFKTIAMHLNSK